MEPKLVEKETMMLAGFSFFGNPFATKDPWSVENEIGKLWQRFMSFTGQNPSTMGHIFDQKGVFCEVHLLHPGSTETGEYEVFVGAEISQLKDLPVEFVLKVLPASLYVVFTISGEQINSDWHQMIYQEWMPQAGYTSAYPFSYQYYDHRFKGVNNLADSVLDVYIPIK
jgi:predicted transcriptional regulator YdeE